MHHQLVIDHERGCEARALLAHEPVPYQRSKRSVCSLGCNAGLWAWTEDGCCREQAQPASPPGLVVEQAQSLVHGPRSARGQTADPSGCNHVSEYTTQRSLIHDL
jgi:hypothetical protein